MSEYRRSKAPELLKNPDERNVKLDKEAHNCLVKAQAISVLQGDKKTFSDLIKEKFKII